MIPGMTQRRVACAASVGAISIATGKMKEINEAYNKYILKMMVMVCFEC